MSTATDNQPSASDAAYKIPNLLDYDEAKDQITKLVAVMDDQEHTVKTNRNLRYTEVDIEGERKAGRIAPDELLVPQHIIDTNIKREQSTYIGYLMAPPRSLVLSNMTNPSMTTEPLERDITNKIRYDGWQLPMFRTVDSMQQNGYGVIELVQDQSKPGHLAMQDVAYDDFGYCLDSKDIQNAEMVTRRYHLTKTQLLALTKIKDETKRFDLDQVVMILNTKDVDAENSKETSLYKIEKAMFRVKGVVQVAWSCQARCNGWLRKPRPLYLGRQRKGLDGIWYKDFETDYPYFLFPYTITENTTIRQFKGRAYFDQDSQEAITSLMSSAVTGYRRSSYLMFGKDTENDPNNDVASQSVICKNGAIINSKVKQFTLAAPDATIFNAIQTLTSANSNEQSNVNYAVNNRQDSRKTATEITAAQQSTQQLSTIQIALFSCSTKALLSTFFFIVRSRVLAGLLTPQPQGLMEMYQEEYSLRPAGDIDVVERQQKIMAMQQSWPVMEHTPAAQLFLSKLIMLLFPEDAPQYIATFQEDQTKSKALGACLQVLTAMVKDPQALGPQEQQNIPQIAALIQQLTMILQPQQQQGQQHKGGGGSGMPQMPSSPMAQNGAGGRPTPQPQGGPAQGRQSTPSQLLVDRMLQMSRMAPANGQNK